MRKLIAAINMTLDGFCDHEAGIADEYQICVQPIILGSGLPLFKNVSDRVNLKLLKTKTFGCGAVALFYILLKEMT